MLSNLLIFLGGDVLFGVLVVGAFLVAPRTTLSIVCGAGGVVALSLGIAVFVSDPVGALVWGLAAVFVGCAVPLALVALAASARGNKNPAWRADYGWAAVRHAARQRRRDRSAERS